MALELGRRPTVDRRPPGGGRGAGERSGGLRRKAAVTLFAMGAAGLTPYVDNMAERVVPQAPSAANADARIDLGVVPDQATEPHFAYGVLGTEARDILGRRYPEMDLNRRPENTPAFTALDGYRQEVIEFAGNYNYAEPQGVANYDATKDLVDTLSQMPASKTGFSIRLRDDIKSGFLTLVSPSDLLPGETAPSSAPSYFEVSPDGEVLGVVKIDPESRDPKIQQAQQQLLNSADSMVQILATADFLGPNGESLPQAGQLSWAAKLANAIYVRNNGGPKQDGIDYSSYVRGLRTAGAQNSAVSDGTWSVIPAISRAFTPADVHADGS
ncbi:MAG TPA: hypothetical protein VLG67_02060 [Candidatus Saccharimonadales bacterium]|nr:hypothetical protein [Candidatus Saccharimonadales bacterium]